ncbi:PaaI family thioesterase [Alcanivorax sp. JB21]|uniref:PaaI family thioesterase n=1 Tax=Alcanivorax limicola TaxID=2874102 RepID=UPI001CBE9515|nr:PaaI family thioesterase [Alcanivorax limicola]MBZ2190362.1 PaaI family thioesterase [Alcanivorax limicola]
MNQPVTSRLDLVREFILAHPLHHACELAFVSAAEGKATLTFQINDFCASPQGTLHGGILYALMDVSCFFAVATLLPADQHAVSVDVGTTLLRAGQRGDTVYLRAHVDRLGRTLAAMRVEASVIVNGEEKLLATGHVNKALISAP